MGLAGARAGPDEIVLAEREADGEVGRLNQSADAAAPAAGAGQPPVETAVAVGTLARYGLLVQFESRAGDQELARLVDSTIWINEAHPAYTRSVASRATGYHTALAVALALAPLAVDVRDEHAFITRFLSHWGASERAARPTRLRRRR